MNENSILIPDGHFLSAENASATADQRDLEALALRVVQMPAVKQAKQQAAGRWKTLIGRDAATEDWGRFDAFIDEWAFSYVLKAVNSDANYPKVLGHFYGPPHEWFGMKVPGSRAGGGDSPDNNYMVAPIDPYAHYELHGRRFEPGPADAPFVICGDVSLATTLNSLDWQDVKLDADGSFVIRLGPEPADVSPEPCANYLQTKLEARYLYLRDVRSDWRQRGTAYRIERLDPPVAPPITLDQMAARAAQYMVFEAGGLYLFNRLFGGIEFNTVMSPFNTGTVGGLTTQMASFGRVQLNEDDAFIVTTGNGGAGYRSLVLMDPCWNHSLDVANHTSSMNNSQSLPNADGSTTYVISLQDSGVHNWLDPEGFHQVLLIHRWQALPRETGDAGSPWIKGELVKLANFDRALPDGMIRVTPDERQRQIEERRRSFRLRYVDH